MRASANGTETEPQSVPITPGLLGGAVCVWLVLDTSARAWGSVRGEAGVPVLGLVLFTALLLERVLYGRGVGAGMRALGFVRPNRPGVVVACAVAGLLLLAFPLYAYFARASLELRAGWPLLCLGLFAQGGLAEELLFRGFVFGEVRRRSSFRSAAGVSTLIFTAAHLPLLGSQPLPVAVAAILLAALFGPPLARLCELSGGSVWTPALWHFVVQGSIKVLDFPPAHAVPFALLWMGLAALLPYAVFLPPLPPVKGES